MPNQKLEETDIAKSAINFYMGMIVVALAIIVWWQKNYHELFLFNLNNHSIADFCAVILLTLALLFTGSYISEFWSANYRKTKMSVMTMLRNVTTFQALYISALSAVGEELLFRGAILPSAGLIFTSIIFGLVHIGPDGKLSIWTLWAFIAGLLLGAVTIFSKQLYPAIFIHFAYNFVSMIRLRKEWQTLPDLQKKILTQELSDLEKYDH